MPSSGVQTCARSEEHTSELQSHDNLVCRLLLEKKLKQLVHSLFRHGGNIRENRVAAPIIRLKALLGECLAYLHRICFFLIDRAPPEINPFPPPAALPF